MRAHVYLDALVSLNRIRRATIDSTPAELQEKYFRHLEVDLIQTIMTKHCQMQARKQDVKFVKTKDCQ